MKAAPHHRPTPARSTHAARSALLPAGLVMLAAIAGCDSMPTEIEGEVAPGAGLEQVDALETAGTTGLTVMSRNMYLGANIDALLSSSDPIGAVATAYEELTISNAGDMGRALALAAEIATSRPHLVGLQEVTRYEVAPLGSPDSEVLVDYADALLAYLGALGVTDYAVVERQANVTLTFPLILPGQPPMQITYQDGDAILARSDVGIRHSVSGHYEAQQTLSIGGTAFVNARGWNAVIAEVEGERIWFVNTHLEIQVFPDVQEAQAAELVERFDDSPLPVVMVGDFNSAANSDAPEASRTGSYRTLRSAGYADIWLRQPHSVGGLTCCQSSTLTNDESQLNQRLDLVLVRWGPASFGGQTWMDVLGEEPSDRIAVSEMLTLWPSDHAGVVATLWPAPGLTVTED